MTKEQFMKLLKFNDDEFTDDDFAICIFICQFNPFFNCDEPLKKLASIYNKFDDIQFTTLYNEAMMFFIGQTMVWEEN